MLNPKKTIPKLAVAALALAGCGDSSGGDGGSGAVGGAGGAGGEGEPTTFEAYCMRLRECNPEPAPIPSVCEDAGLPEGCEERLESYFLCRIEADCEDIYACEDEADMTDILDCLSPQS